MLAENKELEIAFLGEFDTVVAMDGIHRKGEKISSDVVFETATLNKRIKRAVHILSLDENRIAFEPTQMNRDTECPDRITEIWFSGMHSDIGGGRWCDGLADVSLQFMIDQCRASLGHQDISIAESNSIEVRGLLDRQADLLKLLDVDDIMIHPNVTGMEHAHTEGLRKFYSKQVRKVCVRDNDEVLEASECRPLIHHSVKARFDLVPDYRPAALPDSVNLRTTEIRGEGNRLVSTTSESRGQLRLVQKELVS